MYKCYCVQLCYAAAMQLPEDGVTALKHVRAILMYK